MKANLLFLITILPFWLTAQYNETFPTANKGITGGCSLTATDPSGCTGVDLSGVDWTLGGDLSGVDSQEGLFTRTGYLLFEDTDERACWVSPTLDISSAANTEFTVTIFIPSGVGIEASTTVGSIDIVDVEYSVDNGPFTILENVSGCLGNGHTVGNTPTNGASGGSCGDVISGPQTYTPTISGLNGNTLDIRVCVDVNSSSDDVHLQDVDVPTANAVILPVELLFFHAELLEKNVLLQWITASEENNSHFEVERSENGKAFKGIGVVKGAGTSLELQNYTFEDENPIDGTSYYRLRQVDFDGTEDFSSIVTVNKKGESTKFDVFPNPASNSIQVKGGDIALVRIYSVEGKLVKEVLLNDNQNVNINDLVEGMYQVQLIKNNEISTKNLIVQR